MSSSTTRRVLLGALALIVGAALLGAALATPATIDAQPAPTEVPVLGKVQAENACYVRLPDLPVEPDPKEAI